MANKFIKEIRQKHIDGSNGTYYTSIPIGVDAENVFLSSGASLEDALDFIPIDRGGTGNKEGYIQAGQKAGSTIGEKATAEGRDTISSSITTHAEGDNTVASGESSHAEGYYTTVDGNYSHVEGYYSKTGGTSAHAEGSRTTASGEYTHAEGVNTLASASGAHAEGVNTTASGEYAHSGGSNTVASGNGSYTEGTYSKASGANAHAEGYYTTARGNYSHTNGYCTSAGYANQTVIGKYNSNKSDTLFEIGNGTANSAKSNAFEVKTDGEIISKKVTTITFNELITGTGTAGEDKGSEVSPRYFPAKWTFNTGRSLVDGDIITIKIPVAGISYGVYISIDNGTTYKPIIVNGTTALSTHYPVNNYIQLVYEANGSVASIIPISGADAKITVDGGAWRVINFYNTNDNTVPTVYCSTDVATAAKVGTCTNYALLNKSWINVLLTKTNTSASALTLNINNKGAKSIYINGSASSSSNYTLPAGSYLVYYVSNIYYFRTDGKIIDLNTHVYNTLSVANGGTGATSLDNITVGKAKAFNNTALIGNTNKGVYINANGVPTAMSYEVNKTVPSNAVFTDTIALGSMTGTLGVDHGGTGATSVAAARNALGLGNTTGALPVANGGTGTTSLDNVTVGKAKALNNTSKIGNTNKGVYINASGVPTVMSYEVNKTVPSNAVFTDTTALENMTGTLGIIHGGTGNTAGYIQTGQISGETIGTYATAEGKDTCAGNYSHAEGYGTSAFNTSHAEGSTTEASGEYSHAEGNSTLASGDGSHAEGQYTTAMGDNDHAEGYHTFAQNRDPNDAAHAEGSYTTAIGASSHAAGYLTCAGSDCQTVVGRANDNKSDTFFEVGNGNEVTRSNAFEVYRNGDIRASGAIIGSLPINPSANTISSYNNGTMWYADQNGDTVLYIKLMNMNCPIAAIKTPYLKFSSDGNFTLSVSTPHWDGTIEYSINNGGSWVVWNGSQLSGTNSQSIWLRGSNNTKITGPGGSALYKWTFTGKYITGNIETLLNYQTVLNGQHPSMGSYCYAFMFYDCTSLTKAPELPAITLTEGCYYRMFRDCTFLTTAPELPATTLTHSCYYAMFDYCVSLTTAPELPATILAENCYYAMFQNCTSLQQAPELPATTLAKSCYFNMFYDCTSLVQAPKLPATTLATYCYRGMFYNCELLKQVPELPATILEQGCYYEMFNGCTSLIQAPELPAIVLVDSCYYAMFEGCTSLIQLPKLSAIVLVNNCYTGMFMRCSNIKLSTSQTGEYQYEYKIPISGTGTGSIGRNMFGNTGGTFTGTPTINTTYYTTQPPR